MYLLDRFLREPEVQVLGVCDVDRTRRDNANLAQGVRTLRYGWPDVTEFRCRTAAEIAEVLRRQGWTGTLRRCGPACTALRARPGPRQQR